MALLFADRVRVTTSAAPGTGTFAISTPVAAYQGFPASFVVGTQCYYLIEDGTAWETGIGTLTASGVWTRTTVLASSNSNAAISASVSAVLSLTASAQFGTDLQARSDVNLGRNRIRNSRFLINQRGLSGATASGAYTSDGWLIGYTAGTLAWTVAAASATYGYSGSLTSTVTGLTAAGSNQIVTRIESYDVMDLVGQQVTFSAFLLNTTSAGTATVTVTLSSFSAQDNSTSPNLIQTLTLPVTGTAQRLFGTFSALPAAVANGVQINIISTQAGATGNNTLTVAGVQLEAGAYLTPLARIPLYMEVEWCQRFYNAQSGGESFYDSAGGSFFQQYFYPTRMRAAATVTFTVTSVTNTASGAYTAGTVDGFYATTKATAAGLATYTYSYTATAEL